ncbi:MAG: hypothetical protein WAW06_05260 [bacterium]
MITGSRVGIRRAVWVSAIAVALAVGVLGSQADAALTRVDAQLYHWEGGLWKEYCQYDPFPAGGDQPGTNLWKYAYVVNNLSAPQPLNTIYTFFNSDNLAADATWSAAVAPAGWTATQIGPFDPDFNWKERFRTTNSAYYIQAGQALAGFSVEFTWTKAQMPPMQTYDAVFSGGSETSVTTSPCIPSATEETTWGGVKALYR